MKYILMLLCITFSSVASAESLSQEEAVTLFKNLERPFRIWTADDIATLKQSFESENFLEPMSGILSTIPDRFIINGRVRIGSNSKTLSPTQCTVVQNLLNSFDKNMVMTPEHVNLMFSPERIHDFYGSFALLETIKECSFNSKPTDILVKHLKEYFHRNSININNERLRAFPLFSEDSNYSYNVSIESGETTETIFLKEQVINYLQDKLSRSLNP